MSKEKFLISWLGQMGGFVGRVYTFNRSSITCYPDSHPQIYKPDATKDWAEMQRHLEALRAGI